MISNNNLNQNKWLSDALIAINQTEEDEKIDLSSNIEQTDSDKGQKPYKNKHLIYKKSDNKKIITKKIYEESSNSDMSLLDKNKKNDTNKTLIKKYESRVEKLTNQIDDLKRKLYKEKNQN